MEQIVRDFRGAALDDRRRAMLEYAEKLTRRPDAMLRADVERLRRVGFLDVEVLAIAEVTSYYAYVNRIADGLGVVLEEGSCQEDRGQAPSRDPGSEDT